VDRRTSRILMTVTLVGIVVVIAVFTVVSGYAQ
jgi:hypothetical protein